MALSQAHFQRLVTEHGPTLYRMAYRMVGHAQEAEDIVQDTYRSAWKSRQSFRTGYSERAWLITILRRRAVDRWRHKPQPQPLSDPEGLDVAAPYEDPFADQYTDEMQAALARLSPELRECLLMVVVGELTHQETADTLSIPIGTVLSRVSRARKQLRKALLAVAED
ncbi:MAG: RNA polymerase sigma factor [Planctomycetota bacterium]|nr:MAG: RNA polymerase sigma factor [Planctomycetota bacterium]REJ88722.1 MAG: RNA polymerase sigma factor [Planctomycetota bacterium]REK23535.1 MAG: RNA polymerase sigma factor [Planctomycetota bacterium]REK40437.1 MAG: RNA polymerase sigma factor [Planctomycetota bacterium]